MQDFSGSPIDLTLRVLRPIPHGLKNVSRMAVSSFTISRATRATFYFGEVKPEDGISSMPLLHRRGNGASRFQAVPPLCTLRHRESHDSQPSAFRVSRFAIYPRRMLFLLAAIRTRFTSGQCPAAFLFRRQQRRQRRRSAVKYRCCYPAAWNSIHRHDLARWEKGDAEKA